VAPRNISLSALDGLPLVRPGDNIGALLGCAMRRQDIVPADRDILVVAQKIISKAEGRLVDLTGIVPSAAAKALAEEVRKDPRLVELILSESTEVVRRRPDVLIVAHRLGFVMANAGVDQSNVGPEGTEYALLLPIDPDASAAALKAQLDSEFGVDLGVIINDSFGRPWRNGVVGVALGAAGVPALWSRVGAPDLFGRKMRVTEVAIADEIAAAASLLMGQSDEGLPAVHVRGVVCGARPLPASVLLRSRETDLFR
jgi:coenzyme F420-0:L-glutamate ligase/coenzyme F420-1:gamma-L-glutamate ligase